MHHNHMKRAVLLGSVAITMLLAAPESAHAGLVSATDVNPDPDIFEAYLTADEQDIVIDGITVHALVYRDDPPSPHVAAPAGIPAPQIYVKIGDTVIIHLKSELDEGDTSIHWHGIEVDNDSDGTGVTQDQLANGDTYIYRFKVSRPGIFWYHPHMRPTHQDFAGMYGPMIVRDADANSDREGDLEAAGVIPTTVHTVVLSDINFNGDGDVGYDVGGVFKTVNEMIMACADGLNDDPPVMDTLNCNIAEGDTVLVNGEKPDSGAMTPKIVANSGEGIRLRLLNTGIARYFRLRVVDNGSGDANLYRIGGEGGFLEQVRLEGGTLGSWDTNYDEGEIVLGPADRADVVFVPTGDPGDIVKIVSQSYASNPNAPDGGDDFDVLYVEIRGSQTAFTIAAGDDVLGAGAIEDLKGLTITDHLLAPPTGEPGSTNETIRLTRSTPEGDPGPRIDDVVGHFEDSGGDFTAVPHAESSRFAQSGQLLELTIKNETSAHHPFHLHGFSFQPVKVLDADGATLYEFTHNEFVDNFDVHDDEQFVFRVPLHDRGIICDDVVVPQPCQASDNGGSAGRWVFHCHIFHHAALGMISELVVGVLDASVNVKPGSCPNSFNPGSHGVLSVAIAGTPELDVTQIDLASVRISRADGEGVGAAPNEGPPGPHSTFGDSATPFDGEPCDCNEIGGDGVTDLKLKFKTDVVVAALELDGLSHDDPVEVTVSGSLLDGTPFAGTDCLRLVPPGDANADGIVGITDFLEVLTQWGTDPGDIPDFDGNGNVGIEDMLTVLYNWS